MNSRDNNKKVIVIDNISDDTNISSNSNDNNKSINYINSNHGNNSNNNSQRIVAIIGVVLLVIAILALLLTAIFDPTGVWFRACLVLVIALPILLWIYVWLYGMLKQKKTIASFKFLEEDSDEKQENN